MKKEQAGTSYPKLLTDRQEVNGVLHSMEQTARGFLQVRMGANSYLLPIGLKEGLEELQGQHIAVTLIGKKHYLRKMPTAEPSEQDLPRAGLKGIDDGRNGPCIQ